MFSCQVAHVSLMVTVQGFPKRRSWCCSISATWVCCSRHGQGLSAEVPLSGNLPSWHVPHPHSKRTLRCRSNVFSALLCTDAESEIPPEQGEPISVNTNNRTHPGDTFSFKLTQLLFSYLYTSARSLSDFSTDNMKLRSHTSGASV